jgi:outer membrane protein
MIKKTIAGSLLVWGLSLYAQEHYTIDDLIIKSLEISPDIQTNTLHHKAAKKRYESAKSSYLPKVDLTIDASEIARDGIGVHADTLEKDSLLMGQLSLSQLVYDFGKTSSFVGTNKEIANAYDMQAKKTIANKRLEVKEAYYKLLTSKALINVHEENLKLNKIQLFRSQKYYEAGIRTKIDVSDAQVELIRAKIDLKNAQYKLKESFANLDKAVGFQQTIAHYDVYVPKLNIETTSIPQTYELTLKESIEYAYAHRFEIQQQNHTILASQKQVKQVESNYYPSLYFLADYTKQNTQILEQFFPDDQWSMGLHLNWNLYQGGATTINTQEKKIQKQIANSDLLKLKLSIKQEVTNAYINLKRVQDSFELSKSLVEVSNEKFHQASKRYEHGLSDYIELQQARQGYIDAKALLVADYYNYYIAKAYLDNALGK